MCDGPLGSNRDSPLHNNTSKLFFPGPFRMIAFASMTETGRMLNSHSKRAALCYGARFQAKLIYFPESKPNYSRRVKGAYALAALAGYTKLRS